MLTSAFANALAALVRGVARDGAHTTVNRHNGDSERDMQAPEPQPTHSRVTPQRRISNAPDPTSQGVARTSSPSAEPDAFPAPAPRGHRRSRHQRRPQASAHSEGGVRNPAKARSSWSPRGASATYRAKGSSSHRRPALARAARVALKRRGTDVTNRFACSEPMLQMYDDALDCCLPGVCPQSWSCLAR